MPQSPPVPSRRRPAHACASKPVKASSPAPCHPQHQRSAGSQGYGSVPRFWAVVQGPGGALSHSVVMCIVGETELPPRTGLQASAWTTCPASLQRGSPLCPESGGDGRWTPRRAGHTTWRQIKGGKALGAPPWGMLKLERAQRGAPQGVCRQPSFTKKAHLSVSQTRRLFLYLETSTPELGPFLASGG